MATTYSAEWENLGIDIYRLAGYWTRKWARIYSLRHDQEFVADAVASAYLAYCGWRERNEVIANPTGLISVFIRSAARSVVSNRRKFIRHNGRIEQANCVELRDYVAHSPDDTRALELIDSLPAKYRDVAHAAAYTEDCNIYLIADLAGCSDSTARKRLKEMRSLPAIQKVCVA